MIAINDTSTSDILDRGINCLIEHLGVIETEQFISMLIREKFDYTKWRQQFFAGIDSDEFHAAAVEFGKDSESKSVRGVPFDVVLPEQSIKREDFRAAFNALREEAADTPEMFLEEINTEISVARSERKKR